MHCHTHLHALSSCWLIVPPVLLALLSSGERQELPLPSWTPLFYQLVQDEHPSLQNVRGRGSGDIHETVKLRICFHPYPSPKQLSAQTSLLGSFALSSSSAPRPPRLFPPILQAWCSGRLGPPPRPASPFVRPCVPRTGQVAGMLRVLGQGLSHNAHAPWPDGSGSLCRLRQALGQGPSATHPRAL